MITNIFGINFLFSVWSIVFFSIALMGYTLMVLLSRNEVKNGKNISKMKKSYQIIRIVGLIFACSGIIVNLFVGGINKYLTVFTVECYMFFVIINVSCLNEIKKLSRVSTIIGFVIVCVVTIILGAFVRYTVNVHSLQEEKTNIYYIGQDAGVFEETGLSELIFEESDYSENRPIDIELVKGLERDYIEETISYTYSEDRNVEPYRRTMKSVKVTYTLYLDEERYYERIEAK